ncbi:GTPase family protein [Mumia sp. Pv 4-285]|uniref:GTPase family protein n=1 Tax=Mumia qirimensis TaxID=3234852 RepID=UPI00351D9F91
MPDSPTESWFSDAFRNAWETEQRRLGRFNLAIFGKTGVGKSTLVNAIFGDEIAATGIGEPVTREEHLYLHKSGTLGVLDTRGLEVGVDNAAIIAEVGEHVARMRHRPLEEHLHVAWFCVRAGDRRFEETEAEFVRELARLGVPVLLVMTQVPRIEGQVHPDALALAAEIERRELPIHRNHVYLTMALADPFARLEAHGLMDVLDATFRSAPEGVANAITAAQRIDLARKRKRAGDAIKLATSAAGTAGASPIPFSDAAVLVPIQITLMASIASTYGLSLERSTAASLAATAAATVAGRTAVTSLLKLIPGAGTVVGGTVNAAVAGTLTYAVGHAWTRVCERLAQGDLQTVGGALDSATIRRVFMDEFAKQAKRRRPPAVER